MRRERIQICVAVILSLLAGGIGWCFYQTTGLVCEEASVRRDAIPIGKDQAAFEHVYVIRNRSFRTVTLDGVKASCNCQSVTADRVIPPRSKGEVRAVFAVARNAAGERHAEFLVFASGQADPALRLQMTYSFELGVWAYPEQLDLGRVVRGKPVEFTLDVRQEKVPGRAVSQVQSAVAEGISFEVLPVSDDPLPGNEALLNQQVTGRFVNGFGAGLHDRRILVRVDHPDYPVLEIPVRWESVDGLEFSPAALYFGVMGAGAVSSKVITLVSESGPVGIRHAEVLGEGFRLVSCEQTAPGRVAFSVEAQAGGSPGLRKGELAVTLADGRECRAGLLLILTE